MVFLPRSGPRVLRRCFVVPGDLDRIGVAKGLYSFASLKSIAALSAPFGCSLGLTFVAR